MLHIEFKKAASWTSILVLIVMFSTMGCNKLEEDYAVTAAPETPDLTHLPFGGKAPTNILVYFYSNKEYYLNNYKLTMSYYS